MWTKTIKHVICWIWISYQRCVIYISKIPNKQTILKRPFCEDLFKNPHQGKPIGNWNPEMVDTKGGWTTDPSHICVIGSDAPGEHLESLNSRLSWGCHATQEEEALIQPSLKDIASTHVPCLFNKTTCGFVSLEKKTTWKTCSTNNCFTVLSGLGYQS